MGNQATPFLRGLTPLPARATKPAMKAKSLVGIAALLLLMVGTVRAEEKNGLRLSAQKTILDREKEHQAFSDLSRVEKELGLKVAAKNTSFKPMPEGTLSYIIIVKRWGQMPIAYQRYEGTEKLPALKPSEEANLTMGRVKMSGYEGLNKRQTYQDSIEGWQIIVTHAGAETIRIASTGSFDSLNKKAKDGPK